MYDSVENGLSKIKFDNTVMFVEYGVLKGYLRNNPSHLQHLEVFHTTKSGYAHLLFTKNSPLIPGFKKAVSFYRESGAEYILHKRWMGDDINGGLGANKTVLTPGQVIMAFVLMSITILVCTAILCGELTLAYLATN